VIQIEANAFFQQNHLMGVYRAAKTYGLYTQDNELVCCMSLRRSKDDNSLEISRFCSLLYTSVRGGFSKLLKFIEKLHNPSKILSFCDLRYSSGQSYEKLNFKLQATSLGWQWTDFLNIYNRRLCRANMDQRNLTQAEHSAELKWYKIYDAGQAKYVKEL